MGTAHEVFIESCPYTTTGGSHATNAIERYYLRQEAKLIEAKTGRVVAEQSFTGKSPHYCNESEWFGKGDRIVKLVGSEVSDSVVRGWVSSHLFIK